MRSVTRFTSPFAPLHLAAEDEAQLESVSNFFVRKTIGQYEQFMVHEQGAVDCDLWKCIKRKQTVRVYAQRREKEISRRRTRAIKQHQSEHTTAKRVATSLLNRASNVFSGANSAFSGSSSRGFGGGSQYGASSVTSTAPTTSALSTSECMSPVEDDMKSQIDVELPVLLAVGSIPGTLNDAMYGTVAPDVEAMRIKTSYMADNMVDGAVLASILSPSGADPFRTLSIKWTQHDYPLHVRSMVKHRDLVCLESTGTMVISSGEMVGYQLLHSVHFSQTHPLDGVVRGNMSLCTIFRQAGPNTVDVFSKCYLNPSEGFMRNVVINAAAQAMVSVEKAVVCGRMKKLSWVALHQHASGLDLLRSDTYRSRRYGGGDDCCATCKKRASPGLRLLGISERVRCKVCCRFVCSTCKMKKKLSYLPYDNAQLLRQEVTLCNVCVHKSMIKSNARDVAREELVVCGGRRARCVASPVASLAGLNCHSSMVRTSLWQHQLANSAIAASLRSDPTQEFYGLPPADGW